MSLDEIKFIIIFIIIFRYTYLCVHKDFFSDKIAQGNSYSKKKT